MRVQWRFCFPCLVERGAARRSGGAPLPDIRAGTGNLAAKSREFATLINVFWVFYNFWRFYFWEKFRITTLWIICFYSSYFHRNEAFQHYKILRYKELSRFKHNFKVKKYTLNLRYLLSLHGVGVYRVYIIYRVYCRVSVYRICSL